jgi:hypothetical protein
MIEIGVADPLRVTEGKPTRCSGEMDVDISFEVSAKSMNGKKDTREKALFARPVFNDICSDGGNKVHEVTVQPKKDPEFRRHSKGNMLPGGFGKGIQAVFNPDVGCLFAAGRAKSGFTAMRDFHALGTRWADKQMVAEERCSANEQFQNVDDNTEPNKVVVL